MNTNEPISISAALSLVLTTGVAMIAIFVPGLDQAAQIAIVAFGNAIILLGAAVYARRHSTSLAAPVIPSGTVVTVTTPTGKPNATATLEATPTSATTAEVTATPS